MFRPMLRTRQQITEDACIEILKKEKRGVLSVLGDDGYPYGMPINHFYCEADGKLYFHGGRKGHKIDAMQRCDKASFCVYDAGYREGGDWALHINSVIVFGRLSIVEDREKVYELSRLLSLKFTDDEQYIRSEIERFGANTLMFCLTPEHMSGKLVKES